MGQIALTQGKVALVDDDDVEWLSQWKWYRLRGRRSFTGYAVRNVPSQTTRCGRQPRSMQLFIWERHNGLVPEGLELDHKNTDGLDNRLENLRLATHQQNIMNTPPHRDGSSRYKGVSWDTARGYWYARLYADGKMHYLGRFASEEDAAMAYDHAALRLRGEFAYLNFGGAI